MAEVNSCSSDEDSGLLCIVEDNNESERVEDYETKHMSSFSIINIPDQKEIASRAEAVGILNSNAETAGSSCATKLSEMNSSLENAYLSVEPNKGVHLDITPRTPEKSQSNKSPQTPGRSPSLFETHSKSTGQLWHSKPSDRKFLRLKDRQPKSSMLSLTDLPSLHPRNTSSVPETRSGLLWNSEDLQKYTSGAKESAESISRKDDETEGTSQSEAEQSTSHAAASSCSSSGQIVEQKTTGQSVNISGPMISLPCIPTIALNTPATLMGSISGDMVVMPRYTSKRRELNRARMLVRRGLCSKDTCDLNEFKEWFLKNPALRLRNKFIDVVNAFESEQMAKKKPRKGAMPDSELEEYLSSLNLLQIPGPTSELANDSKELEVSSEEDKEASQSSQDVAAMISAKVFQEQQVSSRDRIHESPEAHAATSKVSEVFSAAESKQSSLPMKKRHVRTDQMCSGVDEERYSDSKKGPSSSSQMKQLKKGIAKPSKKGISSFSALLSKKQREVEKLINSVDLTSTAESSDDAVEITKVKLAKKRSAGITIKIEPDEEVGSNVNTDLVTEYRERIEKAVVEVEEPVLKAPRIELEPLVVRSESKKKENNMKRKKLPAALAQRVKALQGEIETQYGTDKDQYKGVETSKSTRSMDFVSATTVHEKWVGNDNIGSCHYHGDFMSMCTKKIGEKGLWNVTLKSSQQYMEAMFPVFQHRSMVESFVRLYNFWPAILAHFAVNTGYLVDETESTTSTAAGTSPTPRSIQYPTTVQFCYKHYYNLKMKQHRLGTICDVCEHETTLPEVLRALETDTRPMHTLQKFVCWTREWRNERFRVASAFYTIHGKDVVPHPQLCLACTENLARCHICKAATSDEFPTVSERLDAKSAIVTEDDFTKIDFRVLKELNSLKGNPSLCNSVCAACFQSIENQIRLHSIQKKSV